MKKVLVILGSPRSGKATRAGVEALIEAGKAANPHVEWQMIDLAGKDIAGCTACGACRKTLTCSVKDDFLPLIDSLQDEEAAAMILASPVYMGSMTGQMKNFIDRTVMFRRNGFLFKNRWGGALAVGGSRNGGQELTIQGLHAAMLIHDMLIVGDGESTAHFGGTLHSLDKEDAAGYATARNLGRRMAELLL